MFFDIRLILFGYFDITLGDNYLYSPNITRLLFVIVRQKNKSQTASRVMTKLLSSPANNGLNPTWPRKPFQFTVCNSAFAFLRFGVYEIDMFNDQNFLAQATFPIQGLKPGTCLKSFTEKRLWLYLTGLVWFSFCSRLPVSPSEEQLQRRFGVGFSVSPRGHRERQGRLLL